MGCEGGVLVVVAHPDDEVLGFGGSAWRLTQRGVPVTTCIASGEVTARTHRPQDDELLEDTHRAAEILGMERPILGDFPNIQMNTVPHLALVQFVEHAIESAKPSHVVTHHLGDLNDDHRQVSAATQAALRLAQRRSGIPPLRSAHTMEIPSSTDWAFAGTHAPFQATAFMEITEEGLSRKLEALAAYRDVMRPFPHPRSTEAIRGLAAYRGGQCGMQYAEALQTLHIDFAALVVGDV